MHENTVSSLAEAIVATIGRFPVCPSLGSRGWGLGSVGSRGFPVCPDALASHLFRNQLGNLRGDGAALSAPKYEKRDKTGLQEDCAESE